MVRFISNRLNKEIIIIRKEAVNELVKKISIWGEDLVDLVFYDAKNSLKNLVLKLFIIFTVESY